MRDARRLALMAAAIGITAALVACAVVPGGSVRPTTATEAVRLALAQQDQFRGIGPLDSNLIGQAAWYQVAAAADGWEVLIRIGWGDCPAGCISEHRWRYAVARDGLVRLAGESGNPLPGATGVRGTVTAGPTCPVVTIPPDPACADRPLAGARLVFRDVAGAEVGWAVSAQDGTFVVELAPGSYRVTAEPVEGLLGTPAPMDVQVDAGGAMTELRVSYDTGIR